MLLSYRCSECEMPSGLMPEPFLCPRTGRLARAHEPTARRTPQPPADPDPDRGRRAKPRRQRRTPAPIDDPLGDYCRSPRSGSEHPGPAR